ERVVLTARGQALAVGGQGQAVHGIRMPFEGVPTLPGRRLPDANQSAVRRDQRFTCGRECEGAAAHPLRAFEPTQLLAGGNLPQINGRIDLSGVQQLASRDERLAVRGKGERRKDPDGPALGRPEAFDLLAGSWVPEVNTTVTLSSRGQEFAVEGEAQVMNIVVLPSQLRGREFFPGGDLPQRQLIEACCVHTSRGQDLAIRGKSNRVSLAGSGEHTELFSGGDVPEKDPRLRGWLLPGGPGGPRPAIR